MSYANYVYAAYAVFVLVLAWDFIVTRVRITQLLRKARLSSSRKVARPARADAGVAP